MKKTTYFIFLLITVLFFTFTCVNSKANEEKKLTDNKYIEKGEKVTITFGYNERNSKINVYKATLEYDEEVFEQIQESNFKTLNEWTQLKYNKDTKEFITINKKGSTQPKDIIQITLKAKDDINIKETKIQVKNVMVSEGEKDIKLDNTEYKINIAENNDENNETQKPANKPNQSTEQNPDQDEENKINQDKDDNIAPGKLPKTGQNKKNILILLTIIILIINILIISKKYKKINSKSLKLFTTIFVVVFVSIQPFVKIHATNYVEMIKSKLNNNQKINNEDVEILQLYLIHLVNLPDDKLSNLDMNNDDKITITDLSILIKNIIEDNEENNYYETVDNIDYRETLENIQNPERGFYTPLFMKMQIANNTAKTSKDNLVHLRVGIGDFSGKINEEKQDKEFTDDMLNALNTTLQNIKKNNGNVIIRFAYDNFEGQKNVEPSLEMILTHISQLKPIFEKNKDVISYVELGFFGPWGEMHSSSICTTENVSKAIDAMLQATPETMKIGVRTPEYYAEWKKINRNELDKDVTEKGTNSYRIGLYNDGYLGSESDLGTFKNREKEIAWLEKQAVHTMYGGEVVANSASGQPLNTVEYMSKEAFKTHTTYLNSQWNNTVINNWKNEIYNGEDELYKGQTGYLYIANHLGYRFVLKNSTMTSKTDKEGNYKISLKVENVGFANVINDKKVTIVLEKDGVFHEISTNIDVTNWNSKEITNINLENTLPQNIEQGSWKVYLRISKYGDLTTDDNYNCIRFANNDIWNEKIGANYIGTIQVVSETEKYDFTQMTPTNSKVTYEPILMADKEMQQYGITGAGSQWPVSLETSKDGSLMLYGIDVAGVFKSTDHGKTWVRANSGITSTGAGMFAIDPHNTNHVATLGLSQYSTVGGIHISYDQAETWNKTLKIGVKGYRYLWDGLEFDPTSYDQEKQYSTDLYFSTPYKRDTQIRTNVNDYRLLTTLQESEVGLYKSTDGGENFSLVINDPKVADGIVRFTNNGKLYIGNQYGLFLINTQTNTIEKEYSQFANNPNISTEASTKGVTGLDVVKNTIYVQTWEGIYKLDENDTITKITDDKTYDKRWPQMLTVSKSNPNHMVYEFRGNVDNYFTTLVNVTFDGGKTWKIAKANLETTFYYNVNFASREKAFIIDPSDDSNVVTFGGDNVFRSSDGGLNFVQASGISNMMQGGKFQLNYYNPDLILFSAQDYTGVVSTDGGKTYTNLIIPGKGNFYAGFVADENTFYGFANTSWGGGTLTYTHDGGKTWTDTGLKAKYEASSALYSSLQSIADPNILFAQEYYSKDKGYTWEEMDGCVGVYAYNYTGRKELYGANKDGKMVVSYDNGDTWNVINENQFSSGSKSETIYDLAYDHVNNYIYAIVRETYANANGSTWGIERIYKYNINTNECTRIEIPRDTERGFMRIKTIAVDPKCTSVIYIGCSGDYFSSSVGLVRSIDGGENWQVLTTANNPNYEVMANNQGGYEVSCVAVDPRTGEVWLASGCYGHSKMNPPYENTKNSSH